MNLMEGVKKEEDSNYVIYTIENLSDQLKQEIRNRLVAICHGTDQTESAFNIYSYHETVKEFLRRYKKEDTSKNRKKGMIGELLVHVVLELERRFTTASPFFNMEERSFKKGYDVALFEISTNELWIAEVKSGEINKRHKNSSSVAVGLINTAKSDLNKRLNNSDTSLWLNALNAAKVSMSENNNLKSAIIKLLGQCADDAVDGKSSSNTFNVVLSAVLFHPVSDCIKAEKIKRKYKNIVQEGLFKNVFIVSIQEETFDDVYKFLESEINNEV